MGVLVLAKMFVPDISKGRTKLASAVSIIEGLWMQGEIDHSLMNPNQMRHNGATVQDNRFSPSPLFIETSEADFVLPLEISGTNILAKTSTPTDGELQLHGLP